jgi:hypothetical protein
VLLTPLYLLLQQSCLSHLPSVFAVATASHSHPTPQQQLASTFTCCCKHAAPQHCRHCQQHRTLQVLAANNRPSPATMHTLTCPNRLCTYNMDNCSSPPAFSHLLLQQPQHPAAAPLPAHDQPPPPALLLQTAPLEQPAAVPEDPGPAQLAGLLLAAAACAVRGRMLMLLVDGGPGFLPVAAGRLLTRAAKDKCSSSGLFVLD